MNIKTMRRPIVLAVCLPLLLLAEVSPDTPLGIALVRDASAIVGVPAIGSVVPALPAGCVAEAKGGTEYQRCGSVYYRAAFQGNNLVYAVVPQP